MMKISRIMAFAVLSCIVAMGGAVALAQSQNGTLEIVGVPTEMVAGRYDPQEGVFFADVTAIAEASIQVKFEEVQITGQKMEWRTKDNYLLVTEKAKLYKDDFELTGDLVEYFGDEKRLEAKGNVIVITEDATIYANQLIYNEETDEAIFTGEVRVLFTDGVLEGEKFLMLLEKSELQFFGSFQGEFKTDSNE